MSGTSRPAVPPPRRGPGHGPFGGGLGMPVAKPTAFLPTLNRLLARLYPERVKIVLVIVLALASVGFAVAGPKLLGNATNILFDGVVGKRLPAGVPKDQVVAALRARGDST